MEYGVRGGSSDRGGWGVAFEAAAGGGHLWGGGRRRLWIGRDDDSVERVGVPRCLALTRCRERRLGGERPALRPRRGGGVRERDRCGYFRARGRTCGRRARSPDPPDERALVHAAANGPCRQRGLRTQRSAGARCR